MQMSRAERNAAIAAAAAANTAATCPWGAGDNSEAGSQAPSSRQNSARNRNTCPWGSEEVTAPANKRSNSRSKQDTCPWSANANDKDSVRLAEAARRRQTEKPKPYGCAGSGAPKLPTGGPVGYNAAPAETTQRLEIDDRPIGGWGQPAMAPSMGGEEMGPGAEDEDPDQVEQRALIQHCLAEGLDEEQIMEMLEQFQNDKLLQQTREKMEMMERGPQQSMPQSKAAAQPKRMPAQAAPQPQQPEGLGLAIGGTSVAASRMAKAKKSLSFGPNDEEIVDVLQDYAKENRTPPESQLSTPTNSLSLAEKRKKDKEPSVAALGAFDADKSRAAYMQSKAQMDKVKARNGVGSSIF